MRAICRAENTGESYDVKSAPNTDGSIDRGLMQVNSIHADMVNGNLESLFDPKVSVEVSHSLWTSPMGYTHWSTYNSGKYLNYL